eukprot:1509067-Rhodomonas_salina.1
MLLRLECSGATGKVAVSDGCAASCKPEGLVQLIYAACTCWARCWAQSCGHECRNVASALHVDVKFDHGISTNDALMRICVNHDVWLLSGDH